MAGFLSQRVGPLNSLIPLTAAAGVLTMAWPYAKTPTSLIIIAILYGIVSGAFSVYIYGRFESISVDH